MWNDNDKIIEIFNNSEDGKTKFPCTCPVCNSQSAHIYVQKHNNQHCGIWIWCSNCKASSHMSGHTPKWWKNPDFIDSAQLCADPEYLDQFKDKIDEWVNSIMPKVPAMDKKPFIMENRFDVIIKEEIQGIPAGTIGIIVVKDDFKTKTIEFIDENGKATIINESTDKLLKIVEVLKSS